MDEKKRLAEALAPGRKTVFFGGAGVSTESGLRDFRSAGGIYDSPYPFPPEEMVSRGYFDRDPAGFYDFYRREMVPPPGTRPNAAHRRLAELEAEGRVIAVVTQNIDGLHQAAGSRVVYELHGSVHRNHCTRCGAFYTLDDVLRSEGVPRCGCGGVIKPDVVLYGEALDETTLNAAVRAIRRADLLLVGGTSLNVYPAAGLLRYFTGAALAVVNKTPTPADARADLVIQASIGRVLGGFED